jgi:glycosyltransferase involved in cell wall biosynthesis
LERIQSWITEPTRNSFVGWTVPYQLNEAFKTVGATPVTGGSGNGRVVNVCFVGRLDRFQKRAHWLPEIMDRCQSFKRNFRWHIYGQGPLEASIKASLAQRKHLNNVCFYGWMDASSLAARLPLHDVFFLCSRWEGLPIAMSEAMLCGLACVVPADSGGMTYALREGGGWLYDANSAAACATALVVATSDLKVLNQRKKEARIIARDLFSGRALDEQLAEFAAGIPKLKYNGNRIELQQAPRMYSVRPIIALKRRLRRTFGIRRADLDP